MFISALEKNNICCMVLNFLQPVHLITVDVNEQRVAVVQPTNQLFCFSLLPVIHLPTDLLSPIFFILYTQSLSDIINNSLFYTICLPMTWICTIQLLAPALILFFATCTTVLVTIHNKLQLNKGKTEALLFNPSKSSDLPNILKIGQLSNLVFFTPSQPLR